VSAVHALGTYNMKQAKTHTDHSYLHAGLSRADVHEHAHLAAAREGRLQKVSELRVAEWHEARSLADGCEDVCEAAQALVDAPGLRGGDAGGVRAVQSLGAGEVAKVEAAPDGLTARARREELEAEDRVGTGARCVHVGRTRRATLRGERQDVVYRILIGGVQCLHREVGDGPAAVAANLDLVRGLLARAYTQQIADLLLIYLEERRLHAERPAVRFDRRLVGRDLLDAPWDHAAHLARPRPLEGVRLHNGSQCKG